MTERSADSAEAVILEEGDEPFDAAERRAGAVHAAALKVHAAAGGLRFEAYLPSDLAVWLLDLIERGVFMDPSEAVFAMLGEQQDLADYPDLRRELLRRTVEAAANDPRPAIPAETVFGELDAMLAAPRPPAAVWDTSITRPRQACAEQTEPPAR
jgi:antitoxin ParD1/3/4